jgi:glycosyltransferase involved in cell wall biosynthesis
MRILYLLHNVTLTGGGGFFNAFHRARHLIRKGHQPTIVTISPTARWGFSETEREGVRIIESPDLLPGIGRSGWDPWDTLCRIVHFRRGGFDIVHGMEARPAVALPSLYLKRARHIPVVLDWMDWYGRGGTASERSPLLRTFMQPVETFCEETFYPLADGCVAMGEPVLTRALSLGIPRERTINLLHGCDPQGIVPIDVHQARQALGTLPMDGVVLGYLGVLRRANAILALEAFEILRETLKVPCRLVLIGNHKLRQLSELIPESLREDVIETGWISYQDLNLYLAASDLLLLPFKKAVSTDNIWPSKLNDHLAAGRATVGTRMRVLEPIFEKYEIGLLTSDDPQEYAAGCLRLLEDRPLQARMAANARALAEGDLSWQRIVDRLEAFYSAIIEATR